MDDDNEEDADRCDLSMSNDQMLDDVRDFYIEDRNPDGVLLSFC
jgi:hypothetical protein